MRPALFTDEEARGSQDPYADLWLIRYVSSWASPLSTILEDCRALGIADWGEKKRPALFVGKAAADHFASQTSGYKANHHRATRFADYPPEAQAKIREVHGDTPSIVR